MWFSPHKFDRLEELLDENQHANTIIVYQYQEELAELKRRFNFTTLDDDRAIERWNAGQVRLLHSSRTWVMVNNVQMLIVMVRLGLQSHE